MKHLLLFIIILIAFIPCFGGDKNTEKKKIGVYVSGDSKISDKDMIDNIIFNKIVKNPNLEIAERTGNFKEIYREKHSKIDDPQDKELISIAKELGEDYIIVIDMVWGVAECYLAGRLLDINKAVMVSSSDTVSPVMLSSLRNVTIKMTDDFLEKIKD